MEAQSEEKRMSPPRAADSPGGEDPPVAGNIEVGKTTKQPFFTGQARASLKELCRASL